MANTAIDGMLNCIEGALDSFNADEYFYRTIREENEKRRKHRCVFPDEITESEFEEIVIDVCDNIRRVIRYSINREMVNITVISNSGLSEWDCVLDFNDYGNLTGRYWVWSENDDSEIPGIVASRISEIICSIIEDDEDYDDEEDDDTLDSGRNMDISPEPMKYDVFFDVVEDAVIDVEMQEIVYLSLAYNPKRKDIIYCIQTCLDDSDESFRVEIVIGTNDDDSFGIYAKDGLERKEVLGIFYNVCVNYNFQPLNGWKNVTDEVNYIFNCSNI